jgi:hypothetical protein
MTVGSLSSPNGNYRLCTANRRYFAVIDLYIPVSAWINRTPLLNWLIAGTGSA